MDMSWKYNVGNRESARRTLGEGAIPRGDASVAREAAQNTSDASLRFQQGAQAAPRLVIAVHEVKNRAMAREFLGAIRYEDELRPHLLAAKDQVGVPPELDQGKRLVIVTIADENCSGMQGTEFERPGEPVEYWAYRALGYGCRFSAKPVGRLMMLAAGSQGLGRHTFFMRSCLKLIIFNSVTAQEWEDPASGRKSNRVLFARNEIPFHFLGDKPYGNGTFGVCLPGLEDVVANRNPASADEMAKKLLVARESAAPGTTIGIVGYGRPRAQASDAEELVSAFKEGLVMSFWPQICEGSLDASVRLMRDGKVVRSEKVDPGQYLRSFVEAYAQMPSVVPVAPGAEVTEDNAFLQPGQVRSADFLVTIPPRAATGMWKDCSFKPGQPYKARCRATVFGLRTDAEVGRWNCEAFPMRGNKMILRTDKSSGKHKYSGRADRDEFAILIQLGRAVASLSPEEVVAADAMEACLVDAETPAHDDFNAETEKVEANYTKTSVRNMLSELRSGWKDVVRRLVCFEVESGDEFYDEDLSDIMEDESDIPDEGGEGGEPTGTKGGGQGWTFRPSDMRSVKDGMLQFKGTLRVNAKDWSAQPVLRAVGEDGRTVPMLSKDGSVLSVVPFERIVSATHKARGGKAKVDGRGKLLRVYGKGEVEIVAVVQRTKVCRSDEELGSMGFVIDFKKPLRRKEPKKKGDANGDAADGGEEGAKGGAR